MGRHNILVTWVLPLLALLGCAATPTPQPAPQTPAPRVEAAKPTPHTRSLPTPAERAAAAKPRLRQVQLFYATDRQPNPAATTFNEYYTGQYGHDLRYGTCVVSIPVEHEVGEVERPFTLFGFELSAEDPKNHFVIVKGDRMDKAQFFQRANDFLQKAPEKTALIFVHGFNVSFREAAWRTAQIAWDLDFRGLPAFYSWSSAGELTGYMSDDRAVELTVPHLKQFLRDFAKQSGAERVFLVAHSMGTRAMTKAIAEVASSTHVYKEVILAAPDIDAEIFRQEIAPNIVKAKIDVTIYASAHDNALAVSKEIRGGFPRLGDTSDGIVVVDGMNTVDASSASSDMLGHSDFSRSLLPDVRRLFQGVPPDQRNTLKPSSDRRYWIFRGLQ